MKHFDIDLNEVEFADELFKQIENDYGRSIARIPKFKIVSPFHYRISVIFTDFKLLEADMILNANFFDEVSIEVTGVYY
jgi:hypothetical protein